MEELHLGKARILKRGSKVAVLSLGAIGARVSGVIDGLEGEQVTHIDMRYMKPLDEEVLSEALQQHEHVLTVEEGALRGGFGSAVLEFANGIGYPNKKVHCLGIGDEFLGHGSPSELDRIAGIDEASIRALLVKILSDR